ncbi:MAG: transposase [Chitinophagales bacterium]
MRSKSEKKLALRQRRIFSENIRKQTVKDIESGRCTVKQAARELQANQQTIYNWLYHYSRYLQKNQVLIVENKSESYRSKELEARIKDLEAVVGRKQLEIELLNKVIELADEHYHTDLKKTLLSRRSSGTGRTKESSTPTK